MAKKVEPIVAHGLTARMFEEIKLRKIAGDEERIPANCASSLQDKFFKEDYKDYTIPMHERNHYHIAMEVRNFNPSTGGRLSVPMVQIFDKVSWLAMKEADTFKPYTAEFVHNPEKEEKNAPLVTLKYTLTDEEAAEQADDDKDDKLTLEEVDALTDVKIAKKLLKENGGKPNKEMTLEEAKAALVEVLNLA